MKKKGSFVAFTHLILSGQINTLVQLMNVRPGN